MSESTTSGLGPWLDTTTAAKYLSLSRRALWEAARRGDVPSYRMGRRLRFRRDELDQLLFKTRVPIALAPEISDEISSDGVIDASSAD